MFMSMFVSVSVTVSISVTMSVVHAWLPPVIKVNVFFRLVYDLNCLSWAVFVRKVQTFDYFLAENQLITSKTTLLSDDTFNTYK